MEKYGIDIWPGFSTRIDQFDEGVMVSIDAISKVMRTHNVLEQMERWAQVHISVGTNVNFDFTIFLNT